MLYRVHSRREDEIESFIGVIALDQLNIIWDYLNYDKTPYTRSSLL